MRLFLLSIIVMILAVLSSHADFLPHDKPTSDFEVGKIDTQYALTYRSWMPIPIIDGHIDVQAWDQSFIGKIEGGYGLGHHFSLRGYTQYRSDWIYIGGNVEHRIHKHGLHIHSGVGIWTESSWADKAFGTRAYVHFRVKHRLTVNTDILFSDNFQRYRIYCRPVIDVPITKHLALLVSAAIGYDGNDLDWHYKYGFRWRW